MILALKQSPDYNANYLGELKYELLNSNKYRKFRLPFNSFIDLQFSLI